MLIYNTTFQVSSENANNFIIYLHEVYLPAIESDGHLHNPRLCRILSHKDDASECFSLQYEVADSSALHKWYTGIGAKLNEDMTKVFKDNVVGFTTLMETIE